MADLFFRVSTERLDLRAVTSADMDEVHELHADPLVWGHFPSGRHTDRAQTAQFVGDVELDWAGTGLGYWTVRPRSDVPGGPAPGTLVGVAGVARRRRPVWNVYYRFAPGAQGFGFATEVVAAARDAASRVDPSLPVVAYLLEHNTGSKRTAERAGLELVWRGSDSGNPDPDAVRLVYADRPVRPEVLAELTGRR